RTASGVPSRLLSSTKIASQPMPSSAVSIRAIIGPILSRSLRVGRTTANSSGSVRPVSESGKHRLANCGGPEVTAKVRTLDTFCQRPCYRGLYACRLDLTTETVAQHHGQRQNHRQRVGFAFPSDVGRGPVDWLIQPLGSEIGLLIAK